MIPKAPGFWKGGCGAQASTLLYLDGADTSTTFTDNGTVSATWSAVGSAQISTAQFPSFASSSLKLPGGTTDHINTPANTSHAILGGDFTVEAFVYLNALSPRLNGYVVASRWDNTSPHGWFLAMTKPASTMFISWGYPFLQQVSSTTLSVPLTAWRHVAVSRKGTQHYFAVHGTVESFSISNRTSESSAALMRVGYDLNSPTVETVLNGYISNYRVTKCARYTSNYNVPTAYFPDPTP